MEKLATGEKVLVQPQVVRLFDEENPLRLSCGEELSPVDVTFETYGALSPQRDNAVLAVHALTGSAHAAFWHSPEDREPGWWHGLIGPDKALDPARHFILCANLLGSRYGTTGPTSRNPRTGRIYGPDFPAVTVRDMARVQKALLDYLEIPRLQAVIGGSLGAMVVWRLAVDYPDLAETVVPIAGDIAASAWVIALNEVARQAIYLDPHWNELAGPNRLPVSGPGLKLARMIAMISYRSEISFQNRFGRERMPGVPANGGGDSPHFQVESYLHHQGDKLVARFDPFTYITLTRAMDEHDVARGYGSPEAALSRIAAQVAVIGIDTDRLFFAHELRATVARLQKLGVRASYGELRSPHGHDAFLMEFGQLNRLVREILER